MEEISVALTNPDFRNHYEQLMKDEQFVVAAHSVVSTLVPEPTLQEARKILKSVDCKTLQELLRQYEDGEMNEELKNVMLQSMALASESPEIKEAISQYAHRVGLEVEGSRPIRKQDFGF